MLATVATVVMVGGNGGSSGSGSGSGGSSGVSSGSRRGRALSPTLQSDRLRY